MDSLETIYNKLMERWDFINRLGGEWNGGYSEGIKFAMDLVYKEQRRLEKEKSAQSIHPSNGNLHELNNKKYRKEA